MARKPASPSVRTVTEVASPTPHCLKVCLAKIPSACVFIAFQLARVGRSRRPLTVKISRRLFNFSAGWSFGEAQGHQPAVGDGDAMDVCAKIAQHMFRP